MINQRGIDLLACGASSSSANWWLCSNRCQTDGYKSQLKTSHTEGNPDRQTQYSHMQLDLITTRRMGYWVFGGQQRRGNQCPAGVQYAVC